jgi:hypothetical protein
MNFGLLWMKVVRETVTSKRGLFYQYIRSISQWILELLSKTLTLVGFVEILKFEKKRIITRTYDDRETWYDKCMKYVEIICSFNVIPLER